jgi:hypothetical protein
MRELAKCEATIDNDFNNAFMAFGRYCVAIHDTQQITDNILVFSVVHLYDLLRS